MDYALALVLTDTTRTCHSGCAYYPVGECILSCWWVYIILLVSVYYPVGECILSCWWVYIILLVSVYYPVGECIFSCWWVYIRVLQVAWQLLWCRYFADRWQSMLLKRMAGTTSSRALCHYWEWKLWSSPINVRDSTYLLGMYLPASYDNELVGVEIWKGWPLGFGILAGFTKANVCWFLHLLLAKHIHFERMYPGRSSQWKKWCPLQLTVFFVVVVWLCCSMSDYKRGIQIQTNYDGKVWTVEHIALLV